MDVAVCWAMVKGGFALNSFGVMLRYQLIEPKISIFDLIGFSGVSVGLGYNSQKFSVDVTHNSNEISTVNFGELQGAWVAKTDFQFASSVKSVPIEVRTGIKLLYFFDFFCGFGKGECKYLERKKYSITTLSSELHGCRSGYSERS